MEKDGWDKLKALSVVISAILVPIVLAVVGHQYNAATETASNRLQYVQLSIDVLSQEPTPANRELREWAIQIVNRYADIPIPSKAVQQLRDSVRITHQVSANEGLIRQLGAALKRGDTNEVDRLEKVLFLREVGNR